jgi:hypothetical protein
MGGKLDPGLHNPTISKKDLNVWNPVEYAHLVPVVKEESHKKFTVGPR